MGGKALGPVAGARDRRRREGGPPQHRSVSKVLGLRLLDADSLRVVYAARLTGAGVIVSASEEDLDNLIGYVAEEANNETDRRCQRGLDDVIRILDAALVAPE